jgi:hypothetical protein
VLGTINAKPELDDFSPAKNARHTADWNPIAAHAHDMDLPTHGLVNVFLDLDLVSDSFLLGMGYKFCNESTFCAACGAAFA